MSLNRLWWGTFRVSYFVAVIFWLSIFLVCWFPPANGNYAKAFAVTLAYNTSLLMVGWAFLPWPRPELPVGITKRR